MKTSIKGDILTIGNITLTIKRISGEFSEVTCSNTATGLEADVVLTAREIVALQAYAVLDHFNVTLFGLQGLDLQRTEFAHSEMVQTVIGRYPSLCEMYHAVSTFPDQEYS